jgi:hypothetical protein
MPFLDRKCKTNLTLYMATFSSPISWKSIALNGLSFLKEGSSA